MHPLVSAQPIECCVQRSSKAWFATLQQQGIGGILRSFLVQVVLWVRYKSAHCNQLPSPSLILPGLQEPTMQCEICNFYLCYHNWQIIYTNKPKIYITTGEFNPLGTIVPYMHHGNEKFNITEYIIITCRPQFNKPLKSLTFYSLQPSKLSCMLSPR